MAFINEYIPQGEITLLRVYAGNNPPQTVYFDSMDLFLIAKYDWRISNMGYAYTTNKKKWLAMHRLLMRPLDDLVVDHLNGNKLDNRRCNLEVVPQTTNMRRWKRREPKYGVAGVYWIRDWKKWRAEVCDGENEKLGTFDTYAEAVEARIVAELIADEF
jgi:hypothetical protein